MKYCQINLVRCQSVAKLCSDKDWMLCNPFSRNTINTKQQVLKTILKRFKLNKKIFSHIIDYNRSRLIVKPHRDYINYYYFTLDKLDIINY